MPKIKDSDLEAILEEVKAELGSLLESERLNKAEESDLEGSKSASPPDMSASNSESSSDSSSSKDDSPGDSEPVPPGETSPASDMGGGDVGMDAASDPAAQTPPDPEALKGEYAALSLDELKMHYMAAKAALFEAMSGAGGDAGAPAGPPPAAPPPDMAAKAEMSGSKSESSSSSSSSMKKEEISSSGNGGLVKSEAEVKLETLEKQMELMTKALELAFNQPVRKAVTQIAHLPKTEEAKPDVRNLTKAEVTKKLADVTRKPNLAKSDRELINKYYANTVKVEDLAHLLQG